MSEVAKHVLKNASLVVNAVDLSDHVKSLTVDSKADEVDVTAMGDTAKQTAVGLSDDSFTVDFYQDYAAAKVDATLWPIKGGSLFLVSAWPDGTTTSATNAKFSATSILPSYQPIAGDIGAANMTSVVFKAQAAIARATA